MNVRDPQYQTLHETVNRLRKELTATQRALATAEKELRDYWNKHKQDDQLPLP